MSGWEPVGAEYDMGKWWILMGKLEDGEWTFEERSIGSMVLNETTVIAETGEIADE